jgi:hypothetical protein
VHKGKSVLEGGYKKKGREATELYQGVLKSGYKKKARSGGIVPRCTEKLVQKHAAVFLLIAGKLVQTKITSRYFVRWEHKIRQPSPKNSLRVINKGRKPNAEKIEREREVKRKIQIGGKEGGKKERGRREGREFPVKITNLETLSMGAGFTFVVKLVNDASKIKPSPIMETTCLTKLEDPEIS